MIDENLRLTYKSSNDDYGFIIPLAIQIHKITTIHIKQLYTLDNNIMYGICTAKSVGLRCPYNHAESISYYAYGGLVYKG